MNKKRVMIGVVCLLLVGGWLFFSNQTNGRKKEDHFQRFATVEKGEVKEDVTAQGRLEAKNYVDVGTQVSGQILKLHIEIGDSVKEGDLLVEIDPRLFQARVDADEARVQNLIAQMEQQKAQSQLAQWTYRRNQKLMKTDAISREEFEKSEAEFKVSTAQIGALKAQMDEAQSTLSADKTNLAYTKIRAPMTGTVVDMPMREGQTVNASQTAPTILRISDLDIMTVRAQVAEADIPKLKEGMEVTFTTLGQMDHPRPARIHQILPTPQILNDVVLYDVLLDADNKDRALMSGMSTQVFFHIGRAENVFVLPVEALTQRMSTEDNAQGTAYKVKVMDQDGKNQERIVHIGISNRAQAEIRDGLKEGDKVVLSSASAASTQNGAPSSSSGGRRMGFGGPRL